MVLPDDEKWLLPENIRATEALESAKSRAGESSPGEVFGAYEGLLSGADTAAVRSHAVLEDHYLSSYAAQAAEVLRSLGRPAPKAVLDAGCGPGALTDALRRAWPGSRALGVDVSRSAVAYATSRYPQTEFRVATIDEALRLENSFDLVHAREFYAFTRTADADFHKRNISILAGFLNPGGVLLLHLVDKERSLSATFARLRAWLPTIGLRGLAPIPFAQPRLARRLPPAWARGATLLADRLRGKPTVRFYAAVKEAPAP